MDETAQTTTAGTPETPLANPALLQLISNMLSTARPSTASATVEPSAPSSESSASDTAPASTVLPPDGLTALLSDPAFLAKLPQIIEMLKPMLQNTAATTVPAMSLQDSTKHDKPPHACRDDLLLALKPFLSKERANAVDTLIRLSRLGNVLGSMK